MREVEKFNAILRWLRYVLEYRLSALYNSENLNLYVCPTKFPVIPTNEEIVDNVDIVRLPDFVKAGKHYQDKRKLFQSKLIPTKPGFYMNFLSKKFVVEIVSRYFLDREGLNVTTKDLFIPEFMDASLRNDPKVYEDLKDQAWLIKLMKDTTLYLSAFKMTFYDELRVMTVKAVVYDGVVLFWEPKFTGELILEKSIRNRPSNFFRFVSRLSYKDIIATFKEVEAEKEIKA